MTDVEKAKRDLQNEIYKLHRRLDALEKKILESMSKNMELQGKVATLAGRIHERH